ncbi:MAG TPA: pimeloyl-ACP methyl ester esterase BioH [Rhodanobacteraceae bacterium]|nr:pimeloyl-ACP methyl ester esterase BioH [Rhodanobacteraceae bacterium]
MSELYLHTEGHGAQHLVLLHGWAMHGGVFAPLVDALRERLTLHVVDLPGHGRSRDARVSLAPAECAAAIAAEVPPAVWLGWSLGGLYALEAALDLPQQVQGLALISASPRFVRGPDWPRAVSAEILQNFARDLEADYATTLARFLALEEWGRATPNADLHGLRVEAFSRHRPDARGLVEGLAVLEHADLRTRLPGLAVPSVWIAGGRDRLIPWPTMQWAAEQCGGRFTCIKGAGHAAFIGHVDEVVAALAPLLTAQPA